MLLEFGENVKVARKLRKLTQQDIADRAGISRQTVSKLEKGDAVSSDTLFSILYVIGLSESCISSVSLERDEVGARLARLSISKSSKASGGI